MTRRDVFVIGGPPSKPSWVVWREPILDGYRWGSPSHDRPAAWVRWPPGGLEAARPVLRVRIS